MFLSKLLLYVMSCIMINNLRGMQVMRRFLFVLLYFVSVQFVWGQTMDVQWFVSAGGAAAERPEPDRDDVDARSPARHR